MNLGNPFTFSEITETNTGKEKLNPEKADTFGNILKKSSKRVF